jgi:hypothetical protein
MGGAFALAHYTGRWRNTKDLDFFVLPQHRQEIIHSITRAGFKDYFDDKPYDRSWIYRAIRDEALIDVIWTLPNHRMEVDPHWFQYGSPLAVQGVNVFAIPAEELIWIKLFVLQRDRCDWPDIMDLLRAKGPDLDWKRLISRMDSDLPLLQAAVILFAWLSPNVAASLPEEIQRWLPGKGAESEKHPGVEADRVKLLDGRPWYAAFQPETQPMQF